MWSLSRRALPSLKGVGSKALSSVSNPTLSAAAAVGLAHVAFDDAAAQVRSKPFAHEGHQHTAAALTSTPQSMSPLRRKYGTTSSSSAHPSYASSSSSGTYYPSFPDAAGATDNNGFVRASNRDYKKAIDEMVRVDHAGEVGAVTIYEGQMWMLRGTKAHDEISRMRAGEVEHLQTMERLMAERRVRPTVFLPIWRAAGFILGASTALLGPQAAMACTVAVETVIGQHYNDQIRDILKGPGRKQKQEKTARTTVSGDAAGAESSSDSESDDADDVEEAPYRMTAADQELISVFKRHRDEELEHLETGIKWDAEKAPAYALISQVIKVGCGAAIEVARRL